MIQTLEEILKNIDDLPGSLPFLIRVETNQNQIGYKKFNCRFKALKWLDDHKGNILKAYILEEFQP